MFTSPLWLSEVERWQIQEWRAIGWPPVLALLGDVLVSKGSGSTRGPTAVAGRLVINCCFHVERTPSLSLYPNGGFTCYGCMACGGIPEFVTELLLLTSQEQLERFFHNATPGVGIHADQLELDI